MEETITPQMTIADIFSKFPSKSQRLAQAMTNAGLHCTSCNAATWETLEAGMLGHGMSADASEKLLNDLNKILKEEIDLNNITLTPRAAEKFRQFAKEEGLDTVALRFGDTAGGCGGFQYILDFETAAPTEEDKTFESEGIQIHIKKAMLGRLLGSVIDYVDGLQGAGFKISNPNVKRSCGCGSSQDY
ncbi:MAG: Iron-sulfur cluster insertion protein ErpA [Chlamydiales bacterium]|nr:Iron-sulfur cluster insertion protein ErpA [Chlamydiales bacterium]MCH9620233.1 Iron-sulfur cluster insertion protein ErpA [Chlamydiales bacterium]MCH9623052.1 Iron-sulfur cluster insertion protein ErpA [Chlamydiales bacterium]